MEKEPGVVKRGPLVRLYVCFVAVIISTLGHEAFLALVQLRVFEAQGIEAIPLILYVASPSMLAFVLALIYVSIQFAQKYPKLPTSTDCIYGVGFVMGLLHTIQVVVYLFLDVSYYVAIFPAETLCACGIPSNMSIYACDCYLPKRGRQKLLTDVSSVSEGFMELPGYLFDESGPVKAKMINTTLEDASYFEFDEITDQLKLMIGLLQCSIVVALLRFPLWVILNNMQVDNLLIGKLVKVPPPKNILDRLTMISLDPPSSPRREQHQIGSVMFDFSDDDERADEVEIDIPKLLERLSIATCLPPPSPTRSTISAGEEVDVPVQTLDDNFYTPELTTSTSSGRESTAFTDVVTTVMRRLRLERNLSHKRWLLRSESRKNKLKSYAYAVELCYFCFVEVVDAFSLLEELAENVDYFRENDALTYCTILFISTTLFISTAANFLASHPFRSRRMNHIGRFITVFSNNLPFFIIRCFMFYTFGGLQSKQVGSVFLLFTLKEGIILVLAACELTFVWRSHRASGAKQVD